MADASQILVHRVISSFCHLSLSLLLIRAASRNLAHEAENIASLSMHPDLVSHKSGAVENRADRMPLIDTNAEVGINGWDVLRFVLRFFF